MKVASLSPKQLRFVLQCAQDPYLDKNGYKLYQLLELFYSLPKENKDDREIIQTQINLTWPKLNLLDQKDFVAPIQDKSASKKKPSQTSGKIKIKKLPFEFKGNLPTDNKGYLELFMVIPERIEVFVKKYKKNDFVIEPFQNEYSLLRAEVMFFMDAYRKFVKSNYSLDKTFYNITGSRLHPKWQKMFTDFLRKKKDYIGFDALSAYKSVQTALGSAENLFVAKH